MRSISRREYHMSHYYWRGFGLLFALIALFFWYDHYQKGKELERSLIDREPLIEARRDFREGKISSLEVFQLTNKKEGPLGKWIIPGEKKIGEKTEAVVLYKKRNSYAILLKEYMLECDLATSNGVDLKPEDLVQVKIQHVSARNDMISLYIG